MLRGKGKLCLCPNLDQSRRQSDPAAPDTRLTIFKVNQRNKLFPKHTVHKNHTAVTMSEKQTFLRNQCPHSQKPQPNRAATILNIYLVYRFFRPTLMMSMLCRSLLKICAFIFPLVKKYIGYPTVIQ